MTVEIGCYVSDLLASNMYVVSEGGRCFVVDPCRMIPISNDLKVDYLFLTHEHYDHISGVNLWRESYPEARVVCSAACANNIVASKRNMARFFPVFCDMQTWFELKETPDANLEYACEADIWFDSQLEMRWSGHDLKFFALPGHSEGGMGIVLDGTHFFSGDSLLPGYETELRFPGGNERDWHEISVPRINSLPEGIVVYPGHFSSFIATGDCLCETGR